MERTGFPLARLCPKVVGSKKDVDFSRFRSLSSQRSMDVESKRECVRECIHAIRITTESRKMRGWCGGGNSSIEVLICSEQQHADERGEADNAHADGESFARALVALALFAFGDAGALSGVVELFGAFGDFGCVSGHGGDGDGRGLDGFCGRFDGRPAGRIGTGSGRLVDVAGHVHLEVEARSGGAAVEVHLARSDGHGHGLGTVSKRDHARLATLSLTGPSEPQMSEYALSEPAAVHCRARMVVPGQASRTAPA